MEFVLVMPILVILAGMIFTMAWAGLVRRSAIEQARNRAWHARFGGGGETLSPGSTGADRLGELADRPADRGLQTGSGSRSRGHVQYLAAPGRYYTFGSLTARANHAVFSDPWDHEVIRFDPRPPLELDRRAFLFGRSTGVAQGLKALAGSIQAPHGEHEAWQKAQQAVAAAANKRDELDREIETLQRRLSDLRKRLQAARAKKDNELAAKLEREIDEVQSTLDRARRAREHLQKGLNLAPRP
jgi:hypothetical protein